MASGKRQQSGNAASNANAVAQSQKAPLLIAAAAVLLAVFIATQWASVARVLEGTPLGNALHIHSSDSSFASGSLTQPVATLPPPPHWGVYRPNLYLGVRGLWGGSPLFGWAWSCANAGPSAGSSDDHHCSAMDQINLLRHDAEERDGVSKYGWLQQDGDGFGVQGILDRKMGVNFTTSFIQPLDEKTGKTKKDRWAVRIQAQPVGRTEAEDLAAAAAVRSGKGKDEPPARTISLFFYTALSSSDHSVELLNHIPSDAAVNKGFGFVGAREQQIIKQRVRAGKEAPELIVRSGVVSSTPDVFDAAVSSSSKEPSAAAGVTSGVRTSFAGLFIDESVPPPVRKGQPPPAPQQFAWAAKDHLQRLLSENYRPKWNAFSAEVGRKQREHDAQQQQQTQKQGIRRPFVAPLPPHFIPELPNKISAGSNFLAIQYVINLPATIDFVLQPAGEDEEEEEGEDEKGAGDAPAESSSSVAAEVGHTERWFSSSSLASALSLRSAAFSQRFDTAFPLSPPMHPSTAPAPVFDGLKTIVYEEETQEDKETISAQKELAQALLSNLLGGVGFFHGRQLVEVAPEVRDVRTGQLITPAKVVEESAPRSLLCAVPSRSFFPRGFLWDEGFHQLLISRWDLGLSLSILGSWFAQIDLKSNPVPGWVAREQIRGQEARRRVPSEFQVQKPDVANPPTLVLALERILERLRETEKKAAGSLEAEAKKKSKEELALFSDFLVRWLPSLHTHVGWYFRTQASSSTWDSNGGAKGIGLIDLSTGTLPKGSASLPLSFRWAGRTLSHCLASGLDDYPRAKWLPTMADKTPPPADKLKPAAAKRLASEAARDLASGAAEFLPRIGAEGHVDLHAWMILLAETMAGLMEYAQEHSSSSVGAANNNNTNTAAAAAVSTPPLINYSAVALSYRSYSSSLRRSLLSLHWDSKSLSFSDYAYRAGSRQLLSQHKGYVSLMPLLLGVLHPVENQLQLSSILSSLLSDTWSLFSPGGLRSLSKKDRNFGSGEDYWRGHVWINMQYLMVSSLQRLAKDETRADQELRTQAAQLALKLRQTVSANVLKEYRRTGFVWEQYNALDGTGRKSHPFTGWSALTLLLMIEEQ